MTTTLSDITVKRKPAPSAEEIAAKELVRLAKEQGLSLTGPDGLFKQCTKNVLETALNEEMTEHLDHEKNRALQARDSTIVRTGTRSKTVLTHATGRSASRSHGTVRAPSNRSSSRGDIDDWVRRDRPVSVCPRADHRGDRGAFHQIYGASVSKETVSRITDKVIEETQAWATRPLEEVNPAIFIDAIVVPWQGDMSTHAKVDRGRTVRSVRRSAGPFGPRATAGGWSRRPVPPVPHGQPYETADGRPQPDSEP